MNKKILSIVLSALLIFSLVACGDTNKSSVSENTVSQTKDGEFTIDSNATIKNLHKTKDEVATLNKDNISKLEEIYKKNDMTYKIFEKNASEETAYVADDSIIVTKSDSTSKDIDFDVFSITLYQMGFFSNVDKSLSTENELPRYEFLIDLTPNDGDKYDINKTIFPEVYLALVGKDKDFSKLNTEINDNLKNQATDSLYKHTFKFNDGDFLVQFKLGKSNSLSISITSPNYVI